VCFDVLEHVENWQRVIREISRVLNKGGIFLFDTINKTFKSKIIMIWLLEDILKQIPRGLHDWNKFIQPQELIEVMEINGFGDVVIKGFDLTGGSNFTTLRDIVLKGLSKPREKEKGELFKIQINEDTSVCYIGTVKLF